ncbi:hypothetical protein GCM10010431_26470 [Streptomyces kunmingensis]
MTHILPSTTDNPAGAGSAAASGAPAERRPTPRQCIVQGRRSALLTVLVQTNNFTCVHASCRSSQE